MMSKKIIATEWVGWYGITAILLAYALVSLQIILVESYGFQLLNLTGAIALIIISSARHIKQLMVLNSIWALVAMISIIRLTFTL